ncbi:MAG: uroporphyrinogen decarboxylase family protein [Armatimonadota bacterium]
MTSRERVLAVINHQRPDRVPIYGWVVANLSEQINKKWGSLTAFEDKYEFDYAHLFGGPGNYRGEDMAEWFKTFNMDTEPGTLLDVPLTDPNVSGDYDGLRADVEHHKIQRDKWVYVQTNGFFECHNGPYGIENHLAYLAEYEDQLHEVYKRQAEWTIQFANNCLDIGIDMIHISDDWGGQHSLMFNPRIWKRLIAPYHKMIIDAVKARGGYVSLHTDGCNCSVVDGIVELGFDVVHPWQESAGMSYELYDQYKGKFTIMGGLDVQTTIGFGRLDALVADIERVLGRFRDGNMLYCTSHFVQDHCSMEELELAFDTVLRVVREQQAKG